MPQRLAQPEEPSRTTGLSPDANEVVRELQSAYLHAVRQVIQSTEDVGDRFVDETRRMHHGRSLLGRFAGKQRLMKQNRCEKRALMCSAS